MKDAQRDQLAQTIAQQLLGLDVATCAEVSARILLGVVEQVRGKEAAIKLAYQIREALEQS